MIELLVVIVILALLISLVTAVASKAIHQQKARNTQQILQNAILAIDQFAAVDPLREVYDRRGQETFGKYPPYQLANANTANSVARALESEHLLTGARPNTLSIRLAHDLSGLGSHDSIDLEDWVLFPNQEDGNDDNRALSAYLRAFSPDALRLIPEDALKPLDERARDHINPKGNGTSVGDDGLADVLGIHDAWGVPLDYLLYVKLEWKLISNPIGNQSEYTGFRVVDRKPVLRSRGISRDVYDEWVKTNTDPTQRERRLSPPDKWIFSEPFCSPAAGVDENGVFIASDATANGWARAVAFGESYGYIPAHDADEP
jgi:type II secretory pathway pseudopilin PulG